MKVLVLGKTGMLGHVVYNYLLEQNYDVLGTSRNGDLQYDAYENMEAIEDIISAHKPDVVVNCIGILNKAAENNKVLAVKVNSLLPHYLDSISNKFNFKLIHISTDCVFEGESGNYTEKSVPDALSFYGRSKALGEVINSKNLTLRTSIVGPDENPNGIGLFQWFMNQSSTVGGYTQVIWTGVTTIQLAKVISLAIKENIVGLNHVVNNEFISKYDLLKLFKKHFKKNIDIEPNDSVISKKTLIRTENSYDFSIPAYDTMVQEMYEWVKEHPLLYPSLITQIESGSDKK